MGRGAFAYPLIYNVVALSIWDCYQGAFSEKATEASTEELPHLENVGENTKEKSNYGDDFHHVHVESL